MERQSALLLLASGGKVPGDVRLCSACFQKAYRYATARKYVHLPIFLPGFPLQTFSTIGSHSSTAGTLSKEAMRASSARARNGLHLAITQDEYYSGRGCAILLSRDDQLLNILMGTSTAPDTCVDETTMQSGRTHGIEALMLPSATPQLNDPPVELNVACTPL